MRFKNLHWGPDRYDKWNAANRRRRETYRRKKAIAAGGAVDAAIEAL